MARYRVISSKPLSKTVQIEPYTVALTSCGRFDLLERTLASLLPRLKAPPARILVAEDSGDRRVYDVVERFCDIHGEIEIILNDPPLGQIRSIDRLYSTIDTEWIFHCEDDWEFYSDGFIEKSFAIMKEFTHFSMVSVRDRADLEENRFFREPRSFSGIQYFVLDPSVKPVWTGLTFNPGLRRMSDYRIVGPYASFGVASNEARVSDCYRKLGYLTAYLDDSAARHIGWERRTRDSAKPMNPVERLNLSIRKRMERVCWTLIPGTDPVEKARRRLEQAGDGRA